MPRLIAERGIEPWRRRLYLPAYRISEAARYAQTNPQTVSYWHYSREDRKPTLPGRERQRPLSYLELVEVAFVAFFRNLGFSLQKIRKAREYIANNLTSEYPFVEYKFKTEGYHILLDFAQFEQEPEFHQLIVADMGGQLGWEEVMGGKFAEFDYEFELAIRWHVSGRESPVVIDPRISFGAPVVKGIPTWALKGRWEAGESVEDIADDFELPEDDIKYALEFEGIKLAA